MNTTERSAYLHGEPPASDSGRARLWNTAKLLAVMLLASPWLASGSESAVPLPAPRTAGGKPVLQALHERQTTREFKPDRLSEQLLSDLLWAAFGVNRADTGGRTAPSAMNSQEIDVYLATEAGLFIYDPKPHQLTRVLTNDVRTLTSGQDFAKVAPLALIFVADLSRMPKAKPEQREFYAGIDTGFISQNVYLFCASEDLATVVHDLDRGPLAKAMNLSPDQRIILGQAVGYPKK